MAGVPSARAVLLDWRGRPAVEQAELEYRFFTSLRMPNGAYKTTAGGRLRELDDRIVELLGARSELRLLDVGVSSGVTTLDLLERLEAAGMRPQAVAADLSVHARLFRAPFGMDLLTDAAGRPLQLSGSWGARGRPAREGAAGLAFESLGRLLRLAAASPREVKLATPRLEGRPGVEIVEQDVFAERADWKGAFDLVRAANLLNLAYFEPERIRGALAVLASYLAPGGLLAVCRTSIETGLNHGTLFRSEGGKLVPAARLGDGSEVESLAPL
ncbi:MAG: hypothetical protein GC160_02490 [Acidobacteria bacterium]|nr:hypothetical protein [Acidobacteriota bacterium]